MLSRDGKVLKLCHHFKTNRSITLLYGKRLRKYQSKAYKLYPTFQLCHTNVYIISSLTLRPWQSIKIIVQKLLYTKWSLYFRAQDPQYKRIDITYWDCRVHYYHFNMFTQKGEHFCVKCVIMVFYCWDVSRGRGKNKEIKYYIFS